MKRLNKTAKEKLIIENFAKVFNKIKRLDEASINADGELEDLELGDDQFLYSITYQTVTPESAEHGDYADQGFIVEKESGTLEEIAREAKNRYGIYSNTSSPAVASSWASVDPERDYQSGEETYYNLHVRNVDGSELSEEQIQFINQYLEDYR